MCMGRRRRDVRSVSEHLFMYRGFECIFCDDTNAMIDVCFVHDDSCT